MGMFGNRDRAFDRRSERKMYRSLAKESPRRAADLCRQYGHQYGRSGECACGARQ